MKTIYHFLFAITIISLFPHYVKSQEIQENYLQDGLHWSYHMAGMYNFVHYGIDTSYHINFETNGEVELKDKTYFKMQFIRGHYDSSGVVTSVPDSCYYFYHYPQRKYTYIKIREEEGRILVDEEEYLALLADSSWWKYDGDASYIPYEKTDDGELVLYNFNKETGDIYSAVEGHDTVWVSMADTMVMDDNSRRRHLILSNGYELIEGIGCINSPGFFLFYLNPYHDFLDFAVLVCHFKSGSPFIFTQDFVEKATEAVDEYVKNRVLVDCPDDNHPHLIDLGLPSGVLWSCCNVGAESPGERGDLYSWGETEVKDSYTAGDYMYFNTGRYYNDEQGPCISGTQYDAAYVNWGEEWRMPTASEIDELAHYCSHEMIDDLYSLVMKVTGPNGKSIFIPFKENSRLEALWSGDIFPFHYDFAHALRLERYTSLKFMGIYTAYNGVPVRPVSAETTPITVIHETTVNSLQGVYDVFGRKISDSTNETQHLPPGIYIIGGKKVLLK